MDFKGEPGKCITLAEAKEKAAAAWNKRQAAIKGMEQQEQAREIYKLYAVFQSCRIYEESN